MTLEACFEVRDPGKRDSGAPQDLRFNYHWSWRM